MKFSKGLIIFIVVINIIFTGAILYVFCKVKSEPVVLVGAWFAFTGTELWNLAQIKKHKLKGEKKNDQESCN